MYVEGGPGSIGSVVAASSGMGVIGGIGLLGGTTGAVLSCVFVALSLALLARVRRSWLDEADADLGSQRPVRTEGHPRRRPPPDWFVDLGSSWGAAHHDESPELTLAHSGRPVGRPPR